MHWIDWTILFSTLLFISIYGVWKTKGSTNLESYIASDRGTKWWAIGLSIMATQASAITFISTPGLGYEQGLRFAQFYYGLPIAMIIIAFWFAPKFFHLKVFTAYEFLEKRFSLGTRQFTASLFLVQRGLSAGITIYAPSIILSEVLGWHLLINIWIIGILVILYTVSGGTKAVTQTHKHQMSIIFIGLFVAFGYLLYYLQQKTDLATIIELSSGQGMLNAFDLKWDLSDRYNVWSGILGGTFLMLSYFGTDQSQVQRYISGRSLKEIRVGLYFNALLKIPLQIFILFVGVLVFWFYTLYEKPISFDHQKATYAESKLSKDNGLLYEHCALNEKKKGSLSKAEILEVALAQRQLDSSLNAELTKLDYKAKVKETDFVFISWILKWLPIGLIGLLLAVIFSAAMSSTAAELNALATTTLVDFYKRSIYPNGNEHHYVASTKWFTLLWGLIAIVFASVASMFDNLVEFVNILGSLFYGTVLGVFIVALYLKHVRARAVMTGGIIAQAFILYVHLFKEQVNQIIGFELAFLWYNLIACLLVVLIALITQDLSSKQRLS